MKDICRSSATLLNLMSLVGIFHSPNSQLHSIMRLASLIPTIR
jgi:hypothetical protein